ICKLALVTHQNFTRLESSPSPESRVQSLQLLLVQS
ncbi:hypothetical protein A2U01_0100050, partial [Trifolium medium]|nr:hypothetical protein [Trifolium medium]